MQTKLLSVSPTGISLYELTNDIGMRVQVINYGARLFAMYVPTRTGEFIDVLAGYATPDEFRGDNPYFNAVIGRVANRIDQSRFTLDGVTYQLNANFFEHHLHGGAEGFDRKLWTVIEAQDGAISMRYVSPDGEEHYPGTLTVTVTYRVGADNSLTLDYTATTDRATPVNLTNHAYFNLDGDFRSVLDHVVRISASRVVTSDDKFVCHGEIIDVPGTIYDFRAPHAIGRDLTPLPTFVAGQGGYDLSYVIAPHAPDAAVASAYSPRTGVKMHVFTDRPCLQFYTGNFLDGTNVGKHVFGYQSAFCMETQDYSNAPNVPTFPSIILRPEDTYHSHTRYAFSVVAAD